MMKRLAAPALVLLLLAALTVVALSLGTTLALFTDTASVPGNTFTTAASFSSPTMATGTYAGDGLDNRPITGVGFQADAVIIKRNTSGEVAVARTSTMTGDATKLLVGGSAVLTNRIQSLDADGFTVGTNGAVNTSGVTYYWIAFKAIAGRLKVASYTGNGTSQSITGAGFSPEYVIILGANANNATHRSSTMTGPFRFDENAAGADGLNSLNPDGFSVGSHAQVNASGITYHYLAWNVDGGTVNVGSYSGDGLDNRPITGVGFQPGFVIAKDNATGALCNRPVHHPSSLAGDNSLYFTTAAPFSDGIQALQADGFQVGTNCSVNTSGGTYHWMAFGP